MSDREGQTDVPPCCVFGKREMRIYMEDFFQIGIITATHGVKGEVKVFPTTDDARRFKRLKDVIVDNGKERVTLEVEGTKFFKQFVILKFKGIDDINAVEKYRRSSLLVTRQNAVRLGRNEYFVADLMGLKVLDEEETEIGVLRDVMETGANDVYVIDLNDGRELLLPAIRQCVLAVDVEAGFIKVHILDGLLDEK
jgi:16S rRNA processing protein RimM